MDRLILILVGICIATLAWVMLVAIAPSLSIGGMIAAWVLFFFAWLAGWIMRQQQEAESDS